MALTKVTYTNNVTVIGADNLNDIQDEIIRLDADKADLDSPALTGTPTAPTPTDGDSSTKIATTEFVEKKADSTYITGTASGAIATFPDGADGVPVQSLTAEINAVQNLNGYDKPWVGGSGKNKYWLKSETKRGLTLTANDNGTYTLTGTFNGTSNNTIGNSDEVTLKAGTYILSSGVTSSYYGISVLNSDASTISGTSYGTDVTFTLSADTNVIFRIYILYNASMGSANVTFRPMLRLSGTTSDFEPYENICPISGWDAVNVYVSPTTDAEDGTTTTISLGSTIYGGTLDVTNGVLTVDKGYVDLGTLNWQTNGDGDGIREFAVVISDKANGITNMMCSALEVKNASGTSGYKCIRGRANSGNVSVVWDIVSVADFKTAVSGYQLVYDLATSQTVTLTPTQVQTVLGENNLWADSGSVSVVYRADTETKIAETSWNFLGTCLSGATVTLTLPNDWTGIVRIWYPYQTTALRYYEIYVICDSNGAVYQFAVSNTSTITLTQAQNTLTLTILSSTNPNTYYFTCEGSGKITATGLE